MIGRQLEEAGWRQGSIVTSKDTTELIENIAEIDNKDNVILLTASQSCDIANTSLESEPYVEFSVGRVIDSKEGNCTYGKNPRVLHAEILCLSQQEEGDLELCYIELKGFEKIKVDKDKLDGLLPDSKRSLVERELQSYVSWLAARYSRDGFPSEFNARIRSADRRNKLRQKAKQANAQLLGVYVEITPDMEISSDEHYHVNLLGMVPSGVDLASVSEAESAITAYAKVMKEAGMDVKHEIRSESDISVAVFKRFKRFALEDLSHKDGGPLPPEF